MQMRCVAGRLLLSFWFGTMACGCEGLWPSFTGYDICLVNHLPYPVTLRLWVAQPVEGLEDAQVGYVDLLACSARRYFGRGPNAGIAPVVLDSQGQPLDVPLEVEERRGYREIKYWIRIGAEDEAACPAPTHEGFELIVMNRTSESLPIAYESQVLGIVSPYTTTVFTPVAGDWCEYQGLTIPGEEGNNRYGGNGDLGARYVIGFPLNALSVITTTVEYKGF
ncbi:MAG: hypothetical protein ACYC5M_08460 [Anaerolineae bacterium]